MYKSWEEIRGLQRPEEGCRWRQKASRVAKTVETPSIGGLKVVTAKLSHTQHISRGHKGQHLRHVRLPLLYSLVFPELSFGNDYDALCLPTLL